MVVSKPETPRQYIFIIFLNYSKETEFFPPIVKGLNNENFMFINALNAKPVETTNGYSEFKPSGPYIGRKDLIVS